MKTKTINYAWVLLFASLVIGCSSDDDNSPQLEAWELEIEQIKEATEKYTNFVLAVSEGFFDASGYVPNMGHHYLNPALADGTFELTKPEIILYVPDQNNEMQMVGVEFAIAPEDPENPGSPPEGLTGDEDHWHFNEEIGMWTLHVWTVLENPDGILAPFNPNIGD